jgi:hypothetical protein
MTNQTLYCEGARLAFHFITCCGLLFSVVLQVALGTQHACALVLVLGTLATGQVYCWGINNRGMSVRVASMAMHAGGAPRSLTGHMPWDAGALGLPGLAVGAALPIPNQAVVLPYPPLQVVATGFTTCALVRSDLENVYCWGLLFDVCGEHRAGLHGV